ncbi:MAG: Lon protease family protein [Paraclostridium sp.]|uniref:Lon protease family protein n=1 Tax=Paraclostridium sp. TaxID=2023273 RepID=UPI003F410E0A
MIRYSNTSELEGLKEIIGQESAIKAMELGLKIDNSAYNIFVAGDSGTGKTTYVLNALKSYAQEKNNHKDWCYVYNFENNREPVAIALDKGMGKLFKKDMDKLIETLLDELKDAFESEDFELSKNELLDDYEIEKDTLLQQIKKYGEEKGFKLKSSKVGMIFTPNDEDIDTTTDEFYKVKKELENAAIQVAYKIKDIEEEAKEALLDLEYEIGKFVVSPHIDVLLEKYGHFEKVSKYLEDSRDDILEYVYLFYLDEDELKDKYDKEHFTRYKVNLLVDNGLEQSEAPVVVEINPSPANLFGKAEYEYYNGTVKTDFTKLLPGAVHKANGGYLVLYVDQLLRYNLSWDILKKTIQQGEITLDTQTAIKPEKIPVNIKVILIGSNYMYNAMYHYDPEFNKYFKIFVDFDNEMKKDQDNEMRVSKFIAAYCEKNNLKHFTYDGVQQIIKYSTRITGDKDKLSTKFNKIVEILVEGDAYASIRGSKFVDKEDVIKAIRERRDRFSKIEKKMDESIENGFTLISTTGSKVGVINGLSVLNMGEYSFGRPSRITVTTAPGSGGIINIEREVEMSGPIHSKGVLILNGFLLENLSQEISLSLNANICFEQNYGGVDGDSASGAELYALLSSLSDTPIKQNIAATGSINQKGDIQVVGGVTEKVEGFYFACKKKGLTGNQGVILPRNNLRNLILLDEVNDAILRGQFHIYPVDRIEEAISILTDKTFDEVKELAIKKLKKYSEIDNK